MPLSTSVARRAYHQRQLDIKGYHREDGLWDIEGHLCDTKTYSYKGEGERDIIAGQPVHDMWLRLTVDDDFVIRQVEAASDATPFSICPETAPRYEVMVGAVLGPGLRREVSNRLGRAHSCTHINEMFIPLATVAYQTIYASGKRAKRDALLLAGKALPPETDSPQPTGKPKQIDSCYGFNATGPVVARLWPDYAQKSEKS